MNEKIKDILRISGIVALVAVSFAATSFAVTYKQSINPYSTPSFSVNGEGKVTVKPDIAEFYFGVTTEGGKNISETQAKNAEKANAAISFLKENGISEDDITTRSYNVEPRYQSYNCGIQPLYVENPAAENLPRICPPADIAGYTVSQTVSVKIRDFAKISDVLSGVVQSGANSVSGISFTVDDPTALQNEARSKALKEAREKAETVAKAGGFRVGRLLSVEDTYQPYYYGFGGAEKGGGDISAMPSPTIEPGAEDLTVRVTLRYAIK